MSDASIDSGESQRRYGEHYAVDYDVRRFTTAEGSFAQRFEEELFERVLHAHGARTVLDAPVGTGRVAIPLAAQFSITGVDISPAMLSSARARAKAERVENIRWVECSVDRLPFPDNHFDAVLTARLFQHVPKQMAHAIVCELSRVIKPGGILVVQFRSGLFGVVLKFLRYYVIRRTGNIRHKCIFPDQVAEFFEGHEIVARFGYKFPVSGRVAALLGYRVVSLVERFLASTSGNSLVRQVHDLRRAETDRRHRRALSDRADLTDTISGQTDVLFGTRIKPSDLRITDVARGTRGIYRVHAHAHPPIIVKRRSFETAAERERVEIETSHEFDVLSAVWTCLNAQGAGHEVPKPLLALPMSGLLFMEQSRGEPLSRFLRRWVFGLHSLEDVSLRLLRCGEWLRAFSCLTPRIAWPVVTPAAAAVLGDGRVRHHVYKLIGLTGADLATTMTGGAIDRLTKWRVDVGLTRRIEAAFSSQLKELGGTRDTQVAVHGKFSPADVLVHENLVSAVDLEQAGRGSVYLDPGYFLYQVYMFARWNPFVGSKSSVAHLRRSFLNGRSQPDQVDESVLDSFIAYYMCNSLRPGGGLAGMSARSYARRWIGDWLARAGN